MYHLAFHQIHLVLQDTCSTSPHSMNEPLFSARGQSPTRNSDASAVGGFSPVPVIEGTGGGAIRNKNCFTLDLDASPPPPPAPQRRVTAAYDANESNVSHFTALDTTSVISEVSFADDTHPIPIATTSSQLTSPRMSSSAAAASMCRINDLDTHGSSILLSSSGHGDSSVASTRPSVSSAAAAAVLAPPPQQTDLRLVVPVPIPAPIESSPGPQDLSGDIAVSTVSLSSLLQHKRKEIAAKPLVRVVIDVGNQQSDEITLREGDDDETCHRFAWSFVSKHELPDEAVEPLAQHLIDKLRAFGVRESRSCDNSNVENRMNSSTTRSSQPSLPENRTERINQSQPQKTRTSEAPRQNTRGNSTVVSTAKQTDSAYQRQSTSTGFTRTPSSYASRSPAPQRVAPNSAVSKQSTSTSARRVSPAGVSTSNPATESSRPPPAGSSRQTSEVRPSTNRQYAGVTARYLSPSRKIEPQAEDFPHAPKIARKSQEIVSRTVYNVSSVHERLHAHDQEIRRKKELAAAELARKATAEAKASMMTYREATAAYPRWGDSHSHRPVGDRLFRIASQQQQRLEEKKRIADEQKCAEELRELTLRPRINEASSHVVSRTAQQIYIQQHYRDPYYIPGDQQLYHASGARSKSTSAVTTEEKEIIEHCTFRPQVNKSSIRSRSGNITDRLYVSPTRGQSTAAGYSVRRPSTSPVRSKNEIEALTSRLYNEGREWELKREHDRELLERIDPKTGQPFFTPQIR